jgi:hypothetical protein
MGIATPNRSRIEPEEIHDILRNHRRRRAIEYLKNRFEPVELRELAERIAEHEAGESPAPRKVRESVYNSLHQTHLPKLDKRAIVEYDKDRKTVKLQREAGDVEAYMDVVNRYGVSWAEYYRSVSVVSLFLIVAAEVELPLITEIPTLALASAFLALLAVSAGYQIWSRRWLYLQPFLS